MNPDSQLDEKAAALRPPSLRNKYAKILAIATAPSRSYLSDATKFLQATAKWQ